MGNPEEAMKELLSSISISEQIGSMWNMPYMHADLALAYRASSDLEQAYQHSKLAVDIALESSGQIELGYALDALARIEDARGDWGSALLHFVKAVEVLYKAEHYLFAARAQLHYAEALLHHANAQEAKDLAETALKTFTELSLPRKVVECQRVLQTIKNSFGT